MNLWGLPGWLFWSAGAFALVSAFLLHFLRVRSRPVTVPTLLFWREAVKEQSPRVLFRRLSRWGSLLLALLVLFFLLFSAGEPGPSGRNAEYRVYLLDPAVLDLPAAKKEAASILGESLPRGRGRTRCALLLASLPARALSSFQDPSRTALAALEEVRRAGVPGVRDWEAGLRAARALLEGRKRASLYVLAVDSAGLPASRTLPGGITLHLVPLPAPLWDDGVQAAMPVRSPLGGWDVLVRARRRGRGGPVRSLTVRASSGAEKTVLLDDRDGLAEAALRGLPPGDRVTARLSGKDPYGANDTLTLEIPKNPEIRVYAPGAGPVLQAALAAVEGVRITGDPSSAQVAVLRKPGAGRKVSSLPALLWGAAAAERPSGGPGPWRAISVHPLVEGLTFTGVRSSALPPGTGPLIPLVRNESGVTAGIFTARPPRILAAADPEDKSNDLWENPDFPRFLARALRALSGIPFAGDGLPAGGWGAVRKGLDGGVLEFRAQGFPPTGIPLARGRGEFPFLPGGRLTLGGLAGPALTGGGPPLSGSLSRAGERPGKPSRGGPSPAFWLGLLGLFFLPLEWWAFNRGRAA